MYRADRSGVELLLAVLRYFLNYYYYYYYSVKRWISLTSQKQIIRKCVKQIQFNPEWSQLTYICPDWLVIYNYKSVRLKRNSPSYRKVHNYLNERDSN
jgi:hypothetical protein